MKKSKQAFTMIELIFVIVIIGILAVVAIPRLSVTRDDAKISKLSHQLQTLKTEIATSIFAKGKVPKNKNSIEEASNTVRELEKSGDLIIQDESGKVNIFLVNKDDSNKEHCKKMVLDYNNSSKVELYIQSENGSTAICKGIDTLVQDINMTIAGNRVGY